MSSVYKLTGSKQYYFNKMYRGLAAQGWKRSMNSLGGCDYRGKGGMKCAIGHIIPDRVARENAGLPLRLSHIEIQPVEVATLLYDAQSYHDTSNQPAEMQVAFVVLAAKHKLTVPTLRGK